jgi:DNA-binding CsgD family transcriptional regulator
MRAATITELLDAPIIEVAAALDALRCAVVLTNERGTILHANRSAERMLRSGDPIQRAHGTLHARVPSAASELRSALALAARNEDGIGKTGVAIRVNEPDGPPMFAQVVSLTGSDLQAGMQPVAAVFIGALPDSQEGADTIAAAFCLTPAETRVLANLFAGRTLTETAATLGIGRTTAKTHLERIFLKTGVTRQAELMRLWVGLISPTGGNFRNNGKNGGPTETRQHSRFHRSQVEPPRAVRVYDITNNVG